MATVDTFRQQLHDIYQYGVNTGDLIVISKQRFEELMADFDDALDYDTEADIDFQNEDDNDENSEFNNWSSINQNAPDPDENENDDAQSTDNSDAIIDQALGKDNIDPDDLDDDDFQSPGAEQSDADVEDDADDSDVNYEPKFGWDGTPSHVVETSNVDADSDDQVQSDGDNENDDLNFDASQFPPSSDNSELQVSTGAQTVDPDDDVIDDGDDLAALGGSDTNLDDDDDDTVVSNDYNAADNAEKVFSEGYPSIQSSSVNSHTSSDDLLDAMLSSENSAGPVDLSNIDVSSSNHDLATQPKSQAPLGSGDLNTANSSNSLFS